MLVATGTKGNVVVNVLGQMVPRMSEIYETAHDRRPCTLLTAPWKQAYPTSGTNEWHREETSRTDQREGRA